MIVKWLSPCWVARFGMAFYVYAYYFIAKKYFDLTFLNERAGGTLSLRK